MATYDSSLTWATEAGVFRYAAIDLTTTSEPTDTDAQQWAYDIASLIVFATEKAGARYEPSDTLSDSHLANILATANEVGAAYEVRCAMFRRSGSERDARVCDILAKKWESFMGEGTASGGSLSGGDGGLIGDIISTDSQSDVVSSDVTVGELTLATVSTRTNVEPEFRMTDAE